MSAQREEILRSALEVFAARGFKGTSIDAVAERAGLTRQGVLHYFPSKKRLLLEIMGYHQQLVREHLAGRGVGEDWAKAFAGAVAYELHRPWLATVHSVIVTEAVTGQEPAAQFVREYSRSVQEHLATRLTRRYGERLPSGLDTRTASTAILCLIEGMHHMLLMDQDADRYPEVISDAMSVLLGVDSGELLQPPATNG
ncbi:TetR/AcrR family transcriptional regulator [Streptomyces sp. NPDC048385]|uniref:TetR/AcrR family transcriptional regulator n=1 Tax=Streptomyces sp. NPDC048385 TaxID=3155145 RepID=UPI00344341B2